MPTSMRLFTYREGRWIVAMELHKARYPDRETRVITKSRPLSYRHLSYSERQHVAVVARGLSWRDRDGFKGLIALVRSRT
jgi:hypothetical protein